MIWHSLTTWALTICWSVAGLVWLAGALYNVRHAPEVRRRASPAYGWAVGGAVLWILFRLPAAAWRPVTLEVIGLQVLGLVLLVVSTAFTLWARGALGTMWSSSVVARAGHALRTDGPYGVTRHPIYTGIIGMILGSALLSGFGRWTAVIVIAIGYLVRKARAEERLLAEVFPADYPRYREEVPQLVPGLRRLLPPRS
jgi:protein-S-isoprenylcysteine O-methyltransferase Ste14